MRRSSTDDEIVDHESATEPFTSQSESLVSNPKKDPESPERFKMALSKLFRDQLPKRSKRSVKKMDRQNLSLSALRPGIPPPAAGADGRHRIRKGEAKARSARQPEPPWLSQVGHSPFFGHRLAMAR